MNDTNDRFDNAVGNIILVYLLNTYDCIIALADRRNTPYYWS